MRVEYLVVMEFLFLRMILLVLVVVDMGLDIGMTGVFWGFKIEKCGAIRGWLAYLEFLGREEGVLCRAALYSIDLVSTLWIGYFRT